MDESIAEGGNLRSIGKILTGPKLGSYWRYRVGSYRIVCDIQDGQLCVWVIDIGDRKEVYRQNGEWHRLRHPSHNQSLHWYRSPSKLYF